MPTIYPEEVYDDEAGGPAHGSGSNPGHGPKYFVNPAPAGLERRHAALRSSGQRVSVAARADAKPSVTPGLTPEQWLAQWCCLDEQT